jgi:arginyl-tRNA synthetase
LLSARCSKSLLLPSPPVVCEFRFHNSLQSLLFIRTTLKRKGTPQFTSTSLICDTMSTPSSTELENLLGELGLKTPVPYFSDTDVLNKPLDIARCYLADILASLVDCDAHTAYSSIQWPNNIYNGDLSIVLPKLKPGADSKVLAFDLQTKVTSSSARSLLLRSHPPKLNQPILTLSISFPVLFLSFHS